jgi:hypothetical protein
MKMVDHGAATVTESWYLAVPWNARAVQHSFASSAASRADLEIGVPAAP